MYARQYWAPSYWAAVYWQREIETEGPEVGLAALDYTQGIEAAPPARWRIWPGEKRRVKYDFRQTAELRMGSTVSSGQVVAVPPLLITGVEVTPEGVIEATITGTMGAVEYSLLFRAETSRGDIIIRPGVVHG